MTNNTFEKLAKSYVYAYADEWRDKNEDVEFTIDDVFIVWSCKTLQNNKALLSTELPDGLYYEVTHNGDKGEIYLDVYSKQSNICFDVSDLECE